MTDFESIQRIVKEFGEENKALIENKLENIIYRLEELKVQNKSHFTKLDELEKRMDAVENHPLKCAITPRLTKIEHAIDNYNELDIPERLLTVEQTLLASASIKKWLLAAIGITATLFGLILGIFKLIGWV